MGNSRQPARKPYLIEQLERRQLLASNVLVLNTTITGFGTVREYSSTFVDQNRSVAVTNPLLSGGLDNDLAVDSNGRLITCQRVGGNYLLSTYENGAWSHRTLTGWDMPSLSGGVLCVIGNRVFVNDYGTGTNPAGIVYFATSGGAGARINGPGTYYDLAAGGDGLLYALRPSRIIDVYDPQSLALLRTVTLSLSIDPGAIAVDASGTIFAADTNQYIHKCSNTGAVVQSYAWGSSSPLDLDVSSTGELLVAAKFTRPKVVTLSPLSSKLLQSGTGNMYYVAWGSLTPPAANGSVSGVVYKDANGNGVNDNGETGLANQTVFVDLNTNGKLDGTDVSAVSGPDGTYSIPSVPPGNYRAYMSVPQGWKLTAPVNSSIDVAVLSGQNASLAPFLLNSWIENPALDTSYGTTGRVALTNLCSAVLPDGRVLAAGVTNAQTIKITRLTAQGVLDPSFGVSGELTTTITSAWPIKLLPISEGRFLLSFDAISSSAPDFALAMFREDGTLENNFGASGIASIGSGTDQNLKTVAVSEYGMITAATSGGTFVRYTQTGAPDSSFGVGGVIKITLGDGGGDVRDLDVWYDDSVFFCGRRYIAGELYGRGYAAHLYNTGYVDMDFGGLDSAYDYGVGYGGCNFDDIELLQDGKILLAGYQHTNDNVVIRLDHDGLADMLFGSGSRALLQVMSPTGQLSESEYPMQMTIAPDGSIYVALIAAGTSGTNPDVAVAKLTPQGNVDTGFNGRGRSFIAFSSSLDLISSIGVHPDGGLIAIGRAGIAKLLTTSPGSARISGFVWQDTTANGQIDSNERTLPGRNVYIDANGNGAMDWNEPYTSTDCVGRYTLRGLAQAAYQVRVEPRPDSQSSNPQSASVNLLAGVEQTDVNFGVSRDLDHSVIYCSLEARYGAPRVKLVTNKLVPPTFFDLIAPTLALVNLETNGVYIPYAIDWDPNSTVQYFEFEPSVPEGDYAIVSSNTTPYVFVEGGRNYSDDYCTPGTLLYGDANNDRQVDTRDFNQLATAFGETFPIPAPFFGDFNYDTVIDSADFDIFLSCYASKLGPRAAFPPPSPALPSPLPAPQTGSPFATPPVSIEDSLWDSEPIDKILLRRG